jgi:hypothetical protein
MSTPRVSPRGLQDVRTLAGSVDQTFLPHRTFLRIACLEMEKFRRTQERASAVRRVASIDRRFGEIDAEKGRLLRTMKGDKTEIARKESSGPAPHGIAPAGAGGVKFRY